MRGKVRTNQRYGIAIAYLCVHIIVIRIAVDHQTQAQYNKLICIKHYGIEIITLKSREFETTIKLIYYL